jgi:regulator of protease activity HflC (stomatin/prohibitin superfamily)
MNNLTGKQTIVLAIVILAVFAGLAWAIPSYNVWRKGLAGQAMLREAEWSKQIAIEEANATMESATMLAKAEVETAKGVAEANAIIGDSLKNNREYLIWRWIEGLHDKNTEVIYIPTEANVPILEAGRRQQPAMATPVTPTKE